MSGLEPGSKSDVVNALRRVMLDTRPSRAPGPGFRAVEELQTIGNQEAISALVDGLQASDPYVAGRAAQALQQMRASQAILALTCELEDRGDDMAGHERTAFEVSVAKLIEDVQAIGDRDAVSILLRLLETSDVAVSTRAARALAELRATEAVPALIQILEVRGSKLSVVDQLIYIRALREMPHASAVGVLSEALYRKGVQEKAARGLAELRTPEATAALEFAANQLGWWRGRRVRRAIRFRKARGLE